MTLTKGQEGGHGSLLLPEATSLQPGIRGYYQRVCVVSVIQYDKMPSQGVTNETNFNLAVVNMGLLVIFGQCNTV
jgi:hypothetical protein